MPIDYSKYPKNWKTEIVPRILERADHCCEFCGVENKSTVFSIYIKALSKRIWVSADSDAERLLRFGYGSDFKPVKIVLTIAHLDHDESNHDVSDDRLMALCQYCHLSYDSEEKVRRRGLKKTFKQTELPLTRCYG